MCHTCIYTKLITVFTQASNSPGGKCGLKMFLGQPMLLENNERKHFKQVSNPSLLLINGRASPNLVSASGSGQYPQFLMVSELVKYVIQVPILLFMHYQTYTY